MAPERRLDGRPERRIARGTLVPQRDLAAIALAPVAGARVAAPRGEAEDVAVLVARVSSFSRPPFADLSGHEGERPRQVLREMHGVDGHRCENSRRRSRANAQKSAMNAQTEAKPCGRAAYTLRASSSDSTRPASSNIFRWRELAGRMTGRRSATCRWAEAGRDSGRIARHIGLPRASSGCGVAKRFCCPTPLDPIARGNGEQQNQADQCQRRSVPR